MPLKGHLHQAISGPRHCLDREATRTLSQAANQQDSAVDNVVTDETSVPTGFNQFVAADDFAFTARKSDQHFQSLRLQPLTFVGIFCFA